MKRILLSFILLLLSATITAQRLTPNQIVPLFKQSSQEVKSFLISNGFSYTKREDDIYTYTRKNWGNNCIVAISFKSNKLKSFSIHQSIMYYDIDLGNLYEQQFELTMSCREDLSLPPIAFPGAFYRFDNNTLKLNCFLITSFNNGYYMNYNRLP